MLFIHELYKAWFCETHTAFEQTFHLNRLLHCLSDLGELRELVECKESKFVIASSISC